MGTKGKYADITPKLPRLTEEPSYQEKINAKKAELLSAWDETQVAQSASLFAREYQDTRAEKESIEEELSEVQLKLTAIEQLLVDRYEVEGVSAIKLDDGSSVGLQFEPTAQVFDRSAFKAWAIEHGYEDRLTLPWQLTNALLKELLLDGESEPPGVKAHTRVKFVLRKG